MTFMKLAVMSAGAVVFAASLIGYDYAPKLVAKTMNKFTGGGGDQHLMRSMMTQMGIPPLETLQPLTQYTMISVGLIGIGVMIYGMLSRKNTQSTSKFTKNKQKSQKIEKENQEKLDMLKESLANGEITYEQYQNILRRIETQN